jgi:hypothetical protein
MRYPWFHTSTAALHRIMVPYPSRNTVPTQIGNRASTAAAPTSSPVMKSSNAVAIIVMLTL